ncbi:MAG: PhzF family phenazine biosynthesis protein [Thermoplasmatota archaeon]
MEYRVVDVFAAKPLEGNPLTVVLDAEGLSSDMMQAIARETNHSETTFVTGQRDGAPRVRIFTPQTELPFAGHPTLGTAHVTGAQALELAVGRIPIQREGDLLWMTQKPATFGPELDLDMVAGAIGTQPLAAQVVSTGNDMAIVRLPDSDAVRAADLEPRAWAGPEVTGIYVFATSSDHDIHARFFGDFVGIHEDPATGSAAGPLAAWLHRAGELEETRIIHQGIEMGRPSQLHLRHEGAPIVGGHVVDVARGQFIL